MPDTVVDFVARDPDSDAWRVVLVEEGPWLGAIENELSRLQERLYGCIDAILDGQLAKKYPESRGRKVQIRVDCYDLPKEAVSGFFERFASGVLQLPDYAAAYENNDYVTTIGFEIHFDSVK